MIRLDAHGYRLTVSPQQGATITSLDWLDTDRPGNPEWRPMLAPLDDPAAGLKAGAFLMAPFANRIDGGRFSFRGQSHSLPLNHPAEGMAIHGFARDQAFQVIAQGTDHAHLSLHFDRPDLPWRFDLDVQITIAATGVGIALDLTNRGTEPMPFGLGLHPWFPKPKGSTLTFLNARSQQRDARGLPLAATRTQPGFAPETRAPLPEMPWFDGIFADWSPREAEISWPEDATLIRLSASGALRHLHVFVPDDRPVFCAEPVSHLPDALNRPALQQMDILTPGASLSGAVFLSAQRLNRLCPSASDQQEVSP